MRNYSSMVVTLVLTLGTAPVSPSQPPRKAPEDSADSLLRKLQSKNPEDRVDALSNFERIYGGWSPGTGTPSEWEKWRLGDLCRALCDTEYSVRFAAAQAFIKVAGRRDRLVEPTDYLIRSLQLKFDDPILEIAMRKYPDNHNERLRNSVRALSAASLAVIYKQNATAIPALEAEAKRSGYSLTGGAAQLAAVKEVQRRIKDEVKPILGELRKSGDKELSAAAGKALETIDSTEGK
jgi:hypothetical protein